MPDQPITLMIKKDKIMLMTDYYFKYENKVIRIPKGFIWDGATIPRFLWSILGVTPFGWANPASLVHDYIYILEGAIDTGIIIPRKWADEKFIKDLIDLKLINPMYSRIYKASLKIGGLYFWKEFYK